MFYWFLKWIAIGPVLRLVFRPQVSGAENVPTAGPAILASNHLSYADWLFMPLTLPRRVTFVAKAEYFTTPGIKGWFQKKFFTGAGQVPIDRSGASAAEGALSSARRILEDVWGTDLHVVENEFTLVGVNPALDEFKDLAAQFRADAEELAKQHGRAVAGAVAVGAAS